MQQAEASQPSQQDLDKLVKANRQFEDQIASIDLQLEQTQQELEQSQQGLAQTQQGLTQTQQELTQTQEELTQAQEELAASEAALQEQTQLVASQRAKHAQQQAQQAASKPLEEECVAKALQVRSLPLLVMCSSLHSASPCQSSANDRLLTAVSQQESAAN